MYETLPVGTELDRGKYRIEEYLGQGGFGITYKATHNRLGQVAIKEFYPREHARREHTTGRIIATNSRGTYERALEKFIREGQILEQISHPNVVRVRDLFEERSTAYLVMEFIQGKTLRTELEAQPYYRLPPSRAGVITEALVNALTAVHQKGIYHLDLKPENVLLTTEEEVKLIDFGAARQGFKGGATQAFSPAYAPPEVIAGKDVGPGSDVFELGAMLYEMLTGQLPDAATARLISFAVETKDCWQPTGLQEPWQRMVAKALKLNLEDRPGSVQEWWDLAVLYWQEEQRERQENQDQQEILDKESREDHTPDNQDNSPRENKNSLEDPDKSQKLKKKVWNPAIILVPTIAIAGLGVWGLKSASEGHYGAALASIEQADWQKATSELELTLRLNPFFAQAREALACVKNPVNDNTELQRTLADLPKCGFVFIEPGTYSLSETIAINESVKLISLSEAKVQIESQAKGAVLEFQGGGLLTLKGINFQYRGTTPAHIMVVREGEVNIENCSFVGARWDSIANEGGDGLVFFGGSGMVKSSSFSNNGLHGIDIQGEAQPTLEDNTVRGNEQAGIVYLGKAGGIARSNVAANNGLSGIIVQEQAQPTLEGNTLRENKEAGIVYVGKGGGTAYNNVAENNGLSGIAVQEQSQPTLEGNILQKNKQAGIVYLGQGGGIARDNVAENNGLSGIAVQEQSQPTLVGNTLRGNKEAGIRYSDTTGGLARDNVVENNSLSGIIVRTHAKPTLEKNTVRGNKQDGLFYFETGGGVAQDNVIENNSLHGIYISSTASPQLSGNKLSGNGEGTIRDER